LIDLHLHTTASDGRLSPSELVARTAAAGLTTISVTDHDTVAAIAEVRRHAAAYRIVVVPGIEVTSVHEGRDVHILGYFFDELDSALAQFLERQRSHRIDRARAIAERLSRLGVPIDIDGLLGQTASNPGASVARPRIARALVDAGHVASVQEAFDRYLASGRPAFVPRTGASPQTVIEVLHAAGGIVSFAHPGVTRKPELLEPLAEAGLDAIEAFHSDHTREVEEEALATARRFNLAVSGGTDYHGEADRRPLGGVTLPREYFDELAARARR
jgi:predicted metal-dependent phosphoesterase TrpH